MLFRRCVTEPMLLSWAESQSKPHAVSCLFSNSPSRLDRLVQSAEELSKDTGRECLPVQADVRQPKALQDAVAKTIEKFGRIDFVICGESTRGGSTGQAVHELLNEDHILRRSGELPCAHLWTV